MTTQTDLFPALIHDHDPASTPAERFVRFHQNNPHVAARLAQMALKLRRMNVRHHGIASLFEVLRYQALSTTGDAYKLNNNYRAFYARLLMHHYPELDGFFLLRASDADAFDPASLATP